MDDRQKLLQDPPSAPPPPYAPAPGMHYTQPMPPPPPISSNYAPPPYDPTQPPPPRRMGPEQRTTIVVQQGTPVPCVAIPAPPDYTALAVIATICFFPLGLVALYMSGKVKTSVANGDYRTAYSEAVSTRILSRLSISMGTIILVCIILAIVLPLTIR